MSQKKIKNALISVYHKDGLAPIIHLLHEAGVKIHSTGGTQEFIEEMNVPVFKVEDLTGYPSILGGRVKTLHPKIFGGILGRREQAGDIAQMEEYEIPAMDLVIVDLYPFEETVASGANHEDIIEKIDIGGISLIRAAAKNFIDVVIVSDRDQYHELGAALRKGKGSTGIEFRKLMAKKAFAVSSHYDLAIFEYFHGTPRAVELEEKHELRYGENPHQSGAFFGDMNALFDKLNGKDLSYNNLLDVDAAVNLMNEFTDAGPTFAVMKHNNACGLATRETLKEAYQDALAGDPVSAFGGVLICNKKMDRYTAELVNELFCEVVIATGFEEEALELLKSKKNRIILKQKPLELPQMTYRSALNGILVQDRDSKTDALEDLKQATKKACTEEEKRDLIFASKICKNTKSNTIVLSKKGQLLASGTGQTSRVDALEQAIAKAVRMRFSLEGAVMASDAFFPFPDCVEIAHKAGIRAVIQPGGSIKDQQSIDFCDAHEMAMVFTGIRHFKH